MKILLLTLIFFTYYMAGCALLILHHEMTHYHKARKYAAQKGKEVFAKIEVRTIFPCNIIVRLKHVHIRFSRHISELAKGYTWLGNCYQIYDTDEIKDIANVETCKEQDFLIMTIVMSVFGSMLSKSADVILLVILSVLLATMLFLAYQISFQKIMIKTHPEVNDMISDDVIMYDEDGVQRFKESMKDVKPPF